MSEQEPAGWHPDPLRQHQRRWWNGQSWTDHVHDDAPPPMPPPSGPAPTPTGPAGTAGPGGPAGTAVAPPPSTSAASGPAPPPGAPWSPAPAGVPMAQPGGYPPAGGYQPAGGFQPGALNAEEIQWGRLSHLLGLLGYLLPIVHVAFPLFIWLTRGKDSAFVAAHAKESLNFQISITLYMFLAGILTVVIIGWFLLIALFVVDIVNIFRGAGAAGRGQQFRYPISIRFVR